jgi:hypothetical protein
MKTATTLLRAVDSTFQHESAGILRHYFGHAPSLKEILETLDAFPTHDNQRYYGFQKTFGIHYEVGDYDKLLNDARKRNRVFTDKLSLAAAR